jgi:hypothetical protein
MYTTRAQDGYAALLHPIHYCRCGKPATLWLSCGWYCGAQCVTWQD